MVEVAVPGAEDVLLTEDTLSVSLSDGRTILVPLAWFPCLIHGTQKERANWPLIGKGHGIHWNNLDEDISIENLLLGQAIGGKPIVIKKWLTSRNSHLKTGAKRRR